MAKKQTAVAAAVAANVGTTEQAVQAAQAEQTTQAAPVPSLAKASPDVATPEQLGTAFARNAIRDASDCATFAYSVRAAGADKDYDAYVAFRDAFKSAAILAKYDDADSLWSRAWKTGKMFGLGEYPKAASVAATTKATQRSDAATKLATMIEGKTPAQLRSEADKVAKGGDYKQAATLTAAAEKVEKAAHRAATDKAKEATADQVARIRAAIKRLQDSGNVAALNAVAKLAEKHSPAPAK